MSTRPSELELWRSARGAGWPARTEPRPRRLCWSPLAPFQPIRSLSAMLTRELQALHDTLDRGRYAAIIRNGIEYRLDYIGCGSTVGRRTCFCSAIGCDRHPGGGRTLPGRMFDRHQVTRLLLERDKAVREALGEPPQELIPDEHVHDHNEIYNHHAEGKAVLIPIESNPSEHGRQCHLDRKDALSWFGSTRCECRPWSIDEPPSCRAFGQ